MSETAVTKPTVDLSPFTDFNEDQVALIKSMICKGGERQATDDELRLFLMVCKRTRLDPFAKQIHAVFRKQKVRDRDGERWVEIMTIQTGIDGYRLIGEMTEEYNGQDEPLWCGEDGAWKDVWLPKEFPHAAKVCVYRKGIERPFVGIALWSEYAQTYVKDSKEYVNPTWSKRPAGQLAKCAEALAFRKAFPQNTSGVYVKEELDQMDNELPEERQLEAPLGDFVVRLKEQPAPDAPKPEPPPVQTMQVPNGPPAPPVAEAKTGKKGKPKPPETAPAPVASAPIPEVPQAAAEPPKAASGPVFVIYKVPSENAPLVRAVTEPDYVKEDVAALRAQALANDTGIIHAVVRQEGASAVKVHEAKPPAAKATTEPVAAPVAPPPPPTEAKPANESTKRLNALAEYMKVPPPTALPRFTNYWCGFFGIDNLKEFRSEWDKHSIEERGRALDSLELIVYRDADMFNSNPRSAGAMAARTVANVLDVAKEFWPGLTNAEQAAKARDLSWRVAISYGFTDKHHYQKWAENVKLDKMGASDAVAFQRLALRSRDAHLVSKAADAAILNMDEIVRQMEEKILKCPLEQAEEAAISQTIKVFLEQVNETQKKPAASAPPPASAISSTDEDLGGLFE